MVSFSSILLAYGWCLYGVRWVSWVCFVAFTCDSFVAWAVAFVLLVVYYIVVTVFALLLWFGFLVVGCELFVCYACGLLFGLLCALGGFGWLNCCASMVVLRLYFI